ncbi:MAG: S-methylmethionine permease, partial [Bacillus sp. (in: firmicutes)]
SLADKNTISPIFAKLTKQGVPIYAVIFSMFGGGLALFSSIIAPDSVYIVLVSISGLAVVVVWMSISASQFLFRRQYIKEGNSVKDLVYRTPFYPLVPIASFILCLASCIGIAFDPTQRIALYCGIPFILFCYASYYLTQRLKKRGVGYVQQNQPY